MARQWDPEQHTFAEPHTSAEGSSAPAREKVLSTASRLFYEEGLRTVGVDRLIAEAPVTKATFYKHFGSRANLVQEYIDLLCTEDQTVLVAVIEGATTAQGVIYAVVELVAAAILDPVYRGSALLNAAAAHPDRDHPVRVRIEAHDANQKAALEKAFAAVGRSDSVRLATILWVLVMGAHGGATVGERIAAVYGLRAAAGVLLSGEGNPRVSQEFGGIPETRGLG